jgi:regulator of protease activity HflC (stomatin/prohibitin superfamily)
MRASRSRPRSVVPGAGACARQDGEEVVTVATGLVVLVYAVVTLIVVASVAAQFPRVTVREYERGLRYVHGRFAGVLEPGSYRFGKWRTEVRTVDLREMVTVLPGQEVLSADGITIRLSLAGSWRITDPAVAVNQVQNYTQALYVTLQLALRRVVGEAPVDDTLERRAELGSTVRELAAPEVARLGLELVSLDVRDIMFPGDLKRVFAQVVQARKEGLAALEKARGETAALRNLANAARLVDGNPSLLQLRLLQQLGAASGNTIVLGLNGAPAALPVAAPPRDGGAEQPDR